MKYACIAGGIALLLFSTFVSYSYAEIPSNAFQNMSIAAAINYTRNFVDGVNASAYLVFYPNMGGAYNYLYKAENVSKSDPSYAYSLLCKAIDSASYQEEHINNYRLISLVALVALAAALALSLYRLVAPLKNIRTNRIKKKDSKGFR
jgi:hypothetical protein